MASSFSSIPFSPTLVPELESPPPQPGQGSYSVALLEALHDYNLLRLLDRASRILVSHSVSSDARFQLVCLACRKPWCCPDVVWAVDWILKAKRHGLLEQLGLEISNDVMALLAAWGSDAPVPAGPVPLRGCPVPPTAKPVPPTAKTVGPLEGFLMADDVLVPDNDTTEDPDEASRLQQYEIVWIRPDQLALPLRPDGFGLEIVDFLGPGDPDRRGKRTVWVRGPVIQTVDTPGGVRLVRGELVTVSIPHHQPRACRAGGQILPPHSVSSRLNGASVASASAR
jgi:hypothetical protein